MSYNEVPLKELLGGKGYIRGPFGSALKRNELKEEGIPVYEQQHAINGVRTFRYFINEDKREKLKRFTVETDDLIISCSGTVGRISIIREDDPKGIISQALLILRPNIHKILPAYLFYFFKSAWGFNELINASQGAVQLNIAPRAVVEKISVPLPSINKQKVIINKLKTLDDKVELNRQTNQTLEQIAQSLFKSWFVDFDPVKAKIHAKKNNQNPEFAAMRTISGKNKIQFEFWLKDVADENEIKQLVATAALFPDELVESEFGDIPKGWNIGTLNELCDLNANSWTKKTAPSEVLYVDLANTKNGVIEDVQYYSWSEAPSRAKRILGVGDTIVGTVRPGNRSYALIGTSEKQLTASTGFAVLTPKKREHVEFLYIAATGDDNIDRLAHLADGGAYPAVRPDVVTKMQLTIPDSGVMQAFNRLVYPLFQNRESNLSAQSTLEALRDTLLPRLLSGEIGLNNKKEIA
jgi:type I restriction enzyme, S subunit